MGISKQPPKPFPIKKGLPCQLKWTHSTVYLTDGVSASCHRVLGDRLEVRDGELNFHNLPGKLEARRKMLQGQWPGRGCEHCKHIEEAGGKSDRIIHLNLEGTTAPPELDTDQNPSHERHPGLTLCQVLGYQAFCWHQSRSSIQSSGSFCC